MISFQVGIFQFIPGFDIQNCVDLKYLVSFICFMILAIDSVDLFDYVPWWVPTYIRTEETNLKLIKFKIHDLNQKFVTFRSFGFFRNSMWPPISGLMAFCISTLQFPNVLRKVANLSNNNGLITYGEFTILFSMVLGSLLVLMRQIRIYCIKPAIITWSFIGGLILQLQVSEKWI